ncbi:MAG: hypothetical protein M0Q15_16075 [Nevskia sp.]|jgi:hypothetical protein|nr:hypothetical protein [Nevskia sp.]
MIAAALAPYRFWIMLACVAALFGGGVYSGHRIATTQADAARTRSADAYLKRLAAETRRADSLAAQLVAAEGRIVTKTVKVIRYVPSVTAGTPCLSGAAVGLLQPGSDWGLVETPGQPAGESPAHLAASDRDVAYWIADANRLYETCAERMNALVAWHGATVDPVKP